MYLVYHNISTGQKYLESFHESKARIHTNLQQQSAWSECQDIPQGQPYHSVYRKHIHDNLNPEITGSFF